ncbi:MAG TPA: tetratricopeptide repeat protein, partial [Gemmatimonadaceae bacterium]
PLLDFDVPTPEPNPDPARRASAALPELTLDDSIESLDVSSPDAESEASEGPMLELILPDQEEEDEAEDEDDAVLELVPDAEPAAEPPARRSSTMFAAQSVEILQASVEGEPENWNLRRELAEAMLDSGDRDGGILELETAMAGAEHSNDLDLAARIAEEIARIDPGTIRHLQKRVEYAFRTNDKPRLIEAYLALGEALGNTDQIDKARAVYQRVLDLAPDDIRAQAGIEALPAAEPEPAPAPAPTRRATTASRKAATPPRGQPAARAAAADDSFINLGDMLRDEVGPADTRMIVDEHEPTGDEEADFQDMLRKFKQGIAQNVDQEDYQSHYDLGIAFKEMGLVDEAIAEFQKALRSPTNRVPTYEALGACFIEKEQYPIATTVLSRALSEAGITDDQLVGVLYLLGRASEALERRDDALMYYQRVFLVDIQFRDVAERISGVERAAR